MDRFKVLLTVIYISLVLAVASVILLIITDDPLPVYLCLTIIYLAYLLFVLLNEIDPELISTTSFTDRFLKIIYKANNFKMTIDCLRIVLFIVVSVLKYSGNDSVYTSAMLDAVVTTVLIDGVLKAIKSKIIVNTIKNAVGYIRQPHLP